MKKEIMFCSTLKAMRPEVAEIEHTINNKMVLDVSFKVNSFLKNGIEYNDITVIFSLLHLGLGELEKCFYIYDLVNHNKDVLIDTIESHYNNDITGIIERTQYDRTFIVMDVQNPCDYWQGTLDDIKDFILSNWGEEDFESEEEEAEHDKEVLHGDFDYLQERCLGMDYLILHDEEERLEWLEEVGL